MKTKSTIRVKESTHLILKCENSDFLLRSTEHHILAGIIIERILDQPVRQKQKKKKNKTIFADNKIVHSLPRKLERTDKNKQKAKIPSRYE